VPDGTVHAVDELTGEVACGFDGELIEIEAFLGVPCRRQLEMLEVRTRAQQQVVSYRVRLVVLYMGARDLRRGAYA
jgi:hypothetical protein